MNSRADSPTTPTVQMPRTTTSPYRTATPTAVSDKTGPGPALIASNTNASITATQTAPTKVSNVTTTITINPPPPTSTSKSLIPNWSYKKSSIAAASIFSAVALIAVAFLATMYIRRLKRRWDQHKNAKRNRKKEFDSAYSAIPLSDDNLTSEAKLAAMGEGKKSSDRESLMFSRSYSPSMAYTVDEPHAFRAYSNNNDSSAGAVDQMERTATHATSFGGGSSISPSRSPSDRTKAAPVNLATLDRQYDPHLLSSQRRSPLAKPIVVVRPPTTQAVPMSARPSSVVDEQTAQNDSHAVSHTADVMQSENSRSSDSVRLARLPSIKRSQSPIMKFEDV